MRHHSQLDKAFIDEPKAKNLRLLPLTMNEILRLRLRMDNRDTSANFAMQRHRKFLAEFRLRASE
jgi:hypothetical protein